MDDPNDVTVWHDFSTVESAKSFASAVSSATRVLGDFPGCGGGSEHWTLDGPGDDAAFERVAASRVRPVTRVRMLQH